MKKPSSTTRQTIALFWQHITRYKRYFIPLIIGVPISLLIMSFSLPYITSQILQKISSGSYDPNNLWGSFGTLVLLYSSAAIASAIVGWRINIWLIWQLELRVTRDIAQRVFNHLINLDANFHANNFGGSLVSQTNKLTGAYIRLADATIFNLYTLVVSMIATVIILAPRAPQYAIVMVLLSVVYIIGATWFTKPVREANRVEAEAQSRQTGYLADSLTNVMAVKSFGHEAYEQDRFWNVTGRTYRAGVRSMRASLVRETYASIITTGIGIASIIIAITGLKVFGTDIATLFLIVTYTANIGERLWEFQQVLRQYNRALGDASDMVKILQIEPEVKDPAHPEKASISRGKIIIEDMTFAHKENSEPLFSNLNLAIKPGEKIGLVGQSGSGKTTLTKVLLRFADIDSGKIMIDRQDIRHIRQIDLRKHIAYVPQEPLLFHRSLSENIAYGQPDADQKAIQAVAKLAHAHEFIGQLPNGYDTLVGERGVKLSGGQRQRVAIARAMLKNAPILILDEATSALDSESELLIQDALWKLMEGRTAIVIAHRLSTIQKMDRILVMEEGKIIEQGTHKELIRQKGRYAELWNHQSGGFLEE